MKDPRELLGQEEVKSASCKGSGSCRRPEAAGAWCTQVSEDSPCGWRTEGKNKRRQTWNKKRLSRKMPRNAQPHIELGRNQVSTCR